MPYFDSHVHSQFSNDSRQTAETIARAALALGLAGVAVTDHANLSISAEDRTFETVPASTAASRAMDAALRGRLRFLQGVEVSEPFEDPEKTRRLLSLADYDAVIGSVHRVRACPWEAFYSQIDFSPFSPAQLRQYLDAYFRELRTLAEEGDFDILAHLSCPLRYINGKYRRQVPLTLWRREIDGILRCLLRRGKALEVNTSCLGTGYDALLPEPWVLARYRALGGRLLTLGSDAHTPECLARGFPETARLLRELGFRDYVHYEARQPRFHPFV